MKAFVDMYTNESLRSQRSMKHETRDNILQILPTRVRVRLAGLDVIVGIHHLILELLFEETWAEPAMLVEIWREWAMMASSRYSSLSLPSMAQI
jgi:hypothetical protein